jgi:hypothetical protein
LQADQVDARPGVEGHDLAPGVDTGVGAAGADQLHGVAEVALEGGDQLAAHGVDAGLDGEAVEPGAQIGDVEADPDRRAGDDANRGRRRRVRRRLVAEEGQGRKKA